MSDNKKLRRFPIDELRQKELYATARRLNAERAAAPNMIAAALNETPRPKWGELVDRPDLVTCGVLEHLDSIIDQTITRDPKYALAVAELAVAIAFAIPNDSYPPIVLAQARASAWKDHGKVLSYLARYDEAIGILAEAERHIASFAALTHDRAVIQLNLAVTYNETGRYTEAVGILDYVKSVFRDHDDDDLFAVSVFIEGLVLQRLLKYREARETYLLLIASGVNISKKTLAALHQSIGLCSSEIGDFEASETSFRKAIALHKELGQPLDALKGEHGKGKLLIRRGLLEQGIAHLRTVRHQYLKASLAEEAGICGLEMVEAFLTLERLENAEALARTIMNEFLAANLNARAVTALGYLSQAIAEKEALPSLATDIREYVLSLRTRPEREFVRPDAN